MDVLYKITLDIRRACTDQRFGEVLAWARTHLDQPIIVDALAALPLLLLVLPSPHKTAEYNFSVWFQQGGIGHRPVQEADAQILVTEVVDSDLSGSSEFPFVTRPWVRPGRSGLAV